MCAADEVALVDTMYRASLDTLTATGALVIIYSREVVYDGDSTVRTGLLALAAGDTAVLTALTHCRALIVVRALYNDALGILDKMNNAVGALSCAYTAADTLSRIDVSYTILDSDSILGTNAYAIAVAEAGEGAKLVTRVVEVCNATAINAVIDESTLGSLAVTVAGNVRNLLDNVLCLNAENSRDICRTLVTAWNTEVGRGNSALSESLCITIASRVSASAAVCTGEAITNSEVALVLLDAEENVCNSKKHGAKKADTGKKQNSI